MPRRIAGRNPSSSDNQSVYNNTARSTERPEAKAEDEKSCMLMTIMMRDGDDDDDDDDGGDDDDDDGDV